MRMTSKLLGWLVGAAALVGVLSAEAGKPTPPPPATAPGTVFFEYSGEIRRINQDGSQAVAIGAATLSALRAYGNTSTQVPIPTSRTYGGKPYWLWSAPRGDGAFYYNDPTNPLITDLFVGVPGDPNRTYRVTDLVNETHQIYLFSPELGQICWSNDGNDSFFSFVGRHLDSLDRYIFKCLVTWTGGVPSAAIMAEIPLPTGGWEWHDWAPSGNTVLYQYVEHDAVSGTYTAHICRHTIRDAQPVLMWSNDRNSFSDLSPSWSPDGTQIAFCRFRSLMERDIVTIPAGVENVVGLDPLSTTVVLTGRYMGYSRPIWAPSGAAQLTCRWVDGRKGIDSSKWPVNVIRQDLPTNTITNLTGNLEQLIDKTIIAWRTGAPAP